jgi:hypothetical protein
MRRSREHQLGDNKLFLDALCCIRRILESVADCDEVLLAKIRSSKYPLSRLINLGEKSLIFVSYSGRERRAASARIKG